jgi:hypothetical protein
MELKHYQHLLHLLRGVNEQVSQKKNFEVVSIDFPVS